ncbi:threonyl-tRNA synthetase [Amaricoccus macauensis]|uniref:Threonine--tRNA ligase n=1 Tax=Amaricoccus macauensis TaxID=57001 RepID=A0A840SQA4_9RHOB|nr:threonine--tRNA ligase [Amaricoccus macauensis]MBB5222628.1 threonyl-tRNA synthetase [Amaricoccus macauensis]
MSDLEPNVREVAVTLPDGAVRQVPAGSTAADVATGISKSLGKAALAAVVDGRLSDLSLPIEKDVSLAIVTAKDEAALELIRHDCAHIMARAVQELWPDVKVTIGPVIDNGWYYDFDRQEPFTPEDLGAIEARMRQIIAARDPVRTEVWERDRAIRHYEASGEPYKVELVEAIPGADPIRMYWHGHWQDLCRGPHLAHTGQVPPDAFKLMSIAGAYWRGDSSRPMLQRIYGVAFRSRADLDAYLHQLEEAAKRDHRKLAKEMDLFHLQPEAQGSVFWHPNGFRLWRELEAYIRRQLDADGYVEVKTPQLLDSKLWRQSGHWGKFRENMFVVPDEVPETADEDADPVMSGKAQLMALKPMNCPGHVQIFRQGTKSYRDLPLRMAEFGCCHRNEAHGALHGLMRVRQMTQDDAHIFCREDQIKDETSRFLALFARVYGHMGMTDISYKLATRPDVRAGDDATWDRAEDALSDALRAAGLEFDIAVGEGAFYGPKLEFHLTDAIGRTWQCGTFQLDYVLPERLDASYVGEDGGRHRPVMLHRAVFGTFERFIGLLIEHYAGRFPLWLAPRQIVVAPIVSEANDYALEVVAALKAAGLRVEADLRNEKINYKVREHSLAKVPVILAVGGREVEERTVSVRRLGEQGSRVAALDAIIAELGAEATPPDLR